MKHLAPKLPLGQASLSGQDDTDPLVQPIQSIHQTHAAFVPQRAGQDVDGPDPLSCSSGTYSTFSSSLYRCIRACAESLDVRTTRQVGVGACLALVTACSSAPDIASAPHPTASPSPSSAQALMQSALNAARASEAVHYVLTYTPPSGSTTGNVANGDGEQWIRNPDGGRVETRLVSNVAYTRGNIAGLQSVGFPAAAAERIAGTWTSVTPAVEALYGPAIDQVTLASVLTYITPTGALRESDHQRFLGSPAIEITGGKPQALLSNPDSRGTGSLFLAPTGDHLPIGFEYTYSGKSGQTEHELWHLTAWGKRFNVARPPRSIQMIDALHGATKSA